MSDTLAPPQRLYGRPFFLLFGALLAFMSGYSLMLHLAKYIVDTGGDVATVSWIFGIGMIGSLLARPHVGKWIDKVGCKPILIAAASVACLTVLSFQWFHDIRWIGALRILLQLTQAALLTTIAVFAARIAPPGRSAEALAMIGVGGLAGMMFGPIIGDAVFDCLGKTDTVYAIFFSLGAALMLTSVIFVSFTPPSRVDPKLGGGRESFLVLLIRHWPGPIIIMALCLALVQTIPTLFIERFVEDRALGGVTFFFIAYSPTAISLRLFARRLPYQLGRRRTLILGLLMYACGAVLLVPVHTAPLLIVPAVIMGAGHSFSYPFLVDLAAEKMPHQHRGVATSVILAAIDVGFLVGFITVGQLIKWISFGPAFLVVAAAVLTGVVYYMLTTEHVPEPDTAT